MKSRSLIAGSLLLLALAGCDVQSLSGTGMVRSGPGPDTAAAPGDQLDGPAVLPSLTGNGLQAPGTIKIGLAVAQADIAFEVAAQALAEPSVTLQPGKTYHVRCSSGSLVLSDGTADLLTAPSPLNVTASSPAAVTYNGRRYRGLFRFIASPDTSNKATLINTVAVEDYLYGVVPVEMSSGWPTEALKTQAVAARTYALANIGRRASLGFDLYDTVSDQVYKGFSVEKADTTSAVDGTRGQVLTWQDRPIAAFFHSSSGG